MNMARVYVLGSTTIASFVYGLWSSIPQWESTVSIDLSIFRSIDLFIYQSINPLNYQSINLSIYLYPSFFLYVHARVHLAQLSNLPLLNPQPFIATRPYSRCRTGVEFFFERPTQKTNLNCIPVSGFLCTDFSLCLLLKPQFSARLWIPTTGYIPLATIRKDGKVTWLGS